MTGRAETYDLAIVGYGPTGMLMAALAGRAGHRVVVLERYRGLYNLPRAACFDDEIMRTFQKLHLVEEISRGAVAQPDYDWVNGDGDTLLSIAYENPAAGGWAALYMMYQPHVEAVLDRRCKGLPTVTVLQGVRVDTLDRRADGVTLAGADHEGGRVTVNARYVVAADGGAGFVRSALGIGSSSYDFEENWLVCDFRKLHELDGVPTFRQVCDPAQPTSIVRIGPHHQRFSFMLHPGETRLEATAPDRVWARVGPYITPQDAELVRVANYVFRSRIADRWRDGRVLLAGDAAHEMPPFLAQGMCSGIRDAHNIAFKLDLVLSGNAGDDLLDTYQAEREPHVRFITEKAIELGRVQTLRDPALARARDKRLLAQRRKHEKPETLRFPALSAGLLSTAPAAGAFFVQGRVRGSGAEGRFDDVVGQGWWVLARNEAALHDLDAERRDRWRKLGGRVAFLGAESASADIRVDDVDGTYDAWFDANGCDAVMVRPDWYVYGAATAGDGIGAVVEELERALMAAA